jgi:beta-glucosidase
MENSCRSRNGAGMQSDRLRNLSLCLILVLLALATACGVGIGNITPPLSGPPPITASPDVRADYVLLQMTLDEKIQLVHGSAGPQWWNQTLPRNAGGFIPGIPRLSVPDLYFEDGSVGVGQSAGQATALPSSIASPATWDTTQAYSYGQVIGAEMKALGLNVNLGGNVNNAGREPRDGRTFETKGEDPILAGKINAAHLKAIQDQFVMAGMKHYALNDQETGRPTANVLGNSSRNLVTVGTFQMP